MISLGFLITLMISNKQWNNGIKISHYKADVRKTHLKATQQSPLQVQATSKMASYTAITRVNTFSQSTDEAKWRST